MNSTDKKPEHRELIHGILGHVTTIRAAIWEIQQTTDLSEENKETLNVASKHAEKMVAEIENLRRVIYPYLEEKTNKD